MKAVTKRAPVADEAVSPKAYSYIRLSTAEQLKGDGLRRMEAGAEQWAVANGMELDDSLQDLGISAFTGENAKSGALSEFMKLVKAGKITKGSILVIESLDRMSSQQLRTGVRMLLDLLDAGIDIVTLGESGFRFRAEATGMDQLVELLLACVSLMRGNEESTIKSERVAKAWSEKRGKASTDLKPMTHLVPGWIRRTETGFEVIETRRETLKEIFRLSARGVRRRPRARAWRSPGL
jgi:DNA invertase Pin-like site-specific DNA recombinase